MKFLFFRDNILNFKDLSHINDSKFEPLLVNEKYKDEVNETLSLKKTYIISPICSSKTSLEVVNNNWNFISIS